MGFAPSALTTRYFLAPHIILAQIYPPNSTFLESPMVLSNPQTPPPRHFVPRFWDLNCMGPLTYFLVIRPLATHWVDLSFTHFSGEFPGLGLALVPDVVDPEEDNGAHGAEYSIQI